jgi:hypothetical protein
MRNSILITVGALLFVGCAHEKPFEVTGVVPPSQMREGSESAATTRTTEPQYAPPPRTSTGPQPTFPSPQRNGAPPPSTRPAPSSARVETEPTAPPVEQLTPRPAPAPTPTPKPQPSKVTVTPESGLQGKVVSVNANLRFVVLNFPVGRMAAVDQQFNVYRQGQKVGEIKITGPQQDDNIIADITTGEVQAGDEVRQN